jgi:hypothetical protein
MSEQGEATLVTDVGQVLGTWTRRTLDGQELRAVRASGGPPLALTFGAACAGKHRQARRHHRSFEPQLGCIEPSARRFWRMWPAVSDLRLPGDAARVLPLIWLYPAGETRVRPSADWHPQSLDESPATPQHATIKGYVGGLLVLEETFFKSKL